MAFNAYYEEKVTTPATVFNVVSWSFKNAGDILLVTINGVTLVDTVDYTFDGVNTVTLTNPTVVDDFLVIRRVTQNDPLVNYGDGTTLVSEDLDLDKEQALDLIEEVEDDLTVEVIKLQEQIGNPPVDVDTDGSLQDQIDAIAAGSVLTQDFTVTIPSQGRLINGDLITQGTPLEDIIIDMLQQDTPPVFSLAGSGAKLVESGTLVSPTLTPTFTANDAGPANNYELRRLGAPIFTNPVPTPHADTPFNIVDTTVSYQATVDHDANVLPAGSLISNTINYVGARAAFHAIGGDPVNIRTMGPSNIGVGNGTQLVGIGDDVSLTYIFAYPATLSDPNSLFLQNTGGNFDITSDLVTETQQLVDDANASNPILYKVFSYTGLIPIKSSDTLTLTI